MNFRPLLKHQKKAFEYTKKCTHPALLMVMRSGKTLVVLRRLKADNVWEHGSLIVGPYCTLVNWKREIMLEGFPCSEIVELIGTRKERLNQLKKQGKFYLINKEGFLSLPEIRFRKWDNVIVDESTILKNPKSKISRFFTENFRNVKRRWILTGSFSSESYLDIFQQLRFLDQNIFPMRSYWDFRNKFFDNSGFYQWTLNTVGRISIPLRLSEKCCIIGKDDLDQKIRKVYTRRLIPGIKAMMKIYDTLQNEFILEVNNKIIDSSIFAIKAFTLMRRLCGGFIDTDFRFPCKTQEILSLLQNELQGQQVVIWCVFRAELHVIKNILTQNNILCGVIDGTFSQKERAQTINNFQNGLFQILIAIDSCFKYSLDFSCADFCIYYSSPTGLETRQQTEARIETIHKNGVKEIIDLQIEGTIDTSIYDSLMKKETRQELLKRIIRKEQKNDEKESY